ncbi:MAG TPA: helix-turn-helix domain-containing protein [Acidimicrobiia bacterium]|nr:helix-turn-helix domain-containing protein [Acidimicrobiia bacterium]
MEPATLIRTVRERAKLSKRELARRAATSAAALVLYESGAREPSFGTLKRISAAAGYEPRLSVVPAGPVDREILGRRLAEVLELAEHLPHRRAPRRITYPPFLR